MKEFKFNSSDRKDWLRDICLLRESIADYSDGIVLSFGQFGIRPEHIAPLACLIEEYVRHGIKVRLKNDQVGQSLWAKNHLREYWGGKQNYAESEDDRMLNLQRIIESEKELYGRRVSSYLKNKYFSKKDMTPVDNSLTEICYNIFDHSQADGNAFSMIDFDEDRSELHVAVCDFGKGIAQTVKDFVKEDISDSDAIFRAMEPRFTIGSTSHNGGLGLGNIIDSCTEKDYLWIVSNGAIIVLSSSLKRAIPLDFNFRGTLIFYTMSLAHFDNEETIDDFNW